MAIFGGVLLLTVIAAMVIERWIARKDVDPATMTRYRVLRRTVVAVVLALGILSALLVIPQVRVVAGGILASSAVLGLVLGFAARTTLGNFIAGVLIAFTQPLRIGDHVTVGDQSGVVEEIQLTYTFIRAEDNARVVIPNEKLASDTIRNATIVDRKQLAEVSFQVPANQDLEQLLDLLRAPLEGGSPDVSVAALDASTATIRMRVRTVDDDAAEQLEEELRLHGHRILRAAGVYA